VNREFHLGVDRSSLVDRLTDDVHDASEALLSDWDHDRQAGIGDRLSADETIGTVHRNGADGLVTQMLGDLEHEAVLVIEDLERIEDLRQRELVELDIDDGADDGGDAASRDELAARLRTSRVEVSRLGGDLRLALERGAGALRRLARGSLGSRLGASRLRGRLVSRERANGCARRATREGREPSAAAQEGEQPSAYATATCIPLSNAHSSLPPRLLHADSL
jgi:hypothetical protein